VVVVYLQETLTSRLAAWFLATESAAPLLFLAEVIELFGGESVD
jgi:hypothetical protein